MTLMDEGPAGAREILSGKKSSPPFFLAEKNLHPLYTNFSNKPFPYAIE